MTTNNRNAILEAVAAAYPGASRIWAQREMDLPGYTTVYVVDADTTRVVTISPMDINQLTEAQLADRVVQMLQRQDGSPAEHDGTV